MLTREPRKIELTLFVTIIKASQSLNETTNDTHLPLKANLVFDCPSQPSPEILALMACTTSSSNLLESLMKKVQVFDKHDLN